MKASTRFIASLFAGLFLGLSPVLGASNEELDKIMAFCTSDTAVPSDGLRKFDSLPDGALRGEMSAQQAMIEAWITFQAANNATAAHDEDLAGRLRNRAVQWLLICVAHDEGAKSVIGDDNNAFLQRLGAWKPPL